MTLSSTPGTLPFFVRVSAPSSVGPGQPFEPRLLRVFFCFYISDLVARYLGMTVMAIPKTHKAWFGSEAHPVLDRVSEGACIGG